MYLFVNHSETISSSNQIYHKMLADYDQNLQTFTAILILSIMTADDLDSTLPQVILRKRILPLDTDLNPKTKK